MFFDNPKRVIGPGLACYLGQESGLSLDFEGNCPKDIESSGLQVHTIADGFQTSDSEVFYSGLAIQGRYSAFNARTIAIPIFKGSRLFLLPSLCQTEGFILISETDTRHTALNQKLPEKDPFSFGSFPAPVLEDNGRLRLWPS